jgi:hypothetical protein
MRGEINPGRKARCIKYWGGEIIIPAILSRAVRDGRSAPDLTRH